MTQAHGNIGAVGTMTVRRGQDPKKNLVEIFDQLPAPIRKALRETIPNWGVMGVSEQYEELLLRYSQPEAERRIIEAIHAAERKFLDAANIGRVWGPGHPQARGLTAQALGL